MANESIRNLEEQIREEWRRKNLSKVPSQPTPAPVTRPAPSPAPAPISDPIPPEEEERGLGGTLMSGLERAQRLGGLAVGTLASLPLGAPASALGIDLPWFPDPGKIPAAFGAFLEQTRKGDWDAAIEEYQDALDAGKYYWGASEVAGGLLPFGAPAFAGTRIAAAAPKLAGTLGKLGAGARTVSGAERAMRGAGKTLRLPWEAEEAVGRAVGRGVGRGAGALGRAAGISRFRRPATEAAGDFAEQATPGGKPPGTPVDTPGAAGQGDRPTTISADIREGFRARRERKPVDLTWRNNFYSKSVNALNDAIEGVTGKRISRPRTGEVSGIIEAAYREKADVTAQIASHQAVVGSYIRRGMSVFTVDKKGRILDANLRNVRPLRRKPGDPPARELLDKPTVQDIAARLPTYRRYLNEEQLKFMESLRDIFENGTEWTLKGGVRVTVPAWNRLVRESVRGWSPNRVRPDIEEGGFFLSRGPARTDERRAAFDEFSSSFTARSGAALNRRLVAENTARSPSMTYAITKKAMVYDSFEDAMVGYIGQVGDKLADLNIIGAAKIAKRRLEKAEPSMRGTVQVRKLSGSNVQLYTDELTDALDRAVRRNRFDLPVVRNINQIYRSMKATADLSALGIHGAFAAFRNPAAWGKAAKVSWDTLFRTESKTFADAALATKDAAAMAEGLFTSDIWATAGLRIGGGATEYRIPGIARLAATGARPARISADILDRFNRSFGTFGDNLRLEWVNNLLRAEVRKGRTLDEIWRSGDAREMATIANKLTGWSANRAGGDLGDLFLFAPRYLQSRFESYAQFISGAGRLATGRAQTIQSREASQTIMRMLGYGAILTEFINWAAGHETDRRPWVDGRPNPNFYAIRVGGQDFSLFGPSIGLFSAVANTVTGHPARALRSLGSGTSRIIWDNIVDGYTFIDEEAMFTRGEDGQMKFTNPARAIQYLGELTLPIAPTQMVGQAVGIAQQIPGAVRQATGDPTEEEQVGPSPIERIIGGGLALGAEMIGTRVSPLSRADWQNEIARELYGSTYDELNADVKVTVDSLVTERYGERVYRGPKGHLYEKKDKANATFISGLEAVSEKWLSASPESTEWSPLNAKKGPGGYNELREERIEKLYGFWDSEKGRLAGGLYDRLYDMDEEREEPELGTREHRVWQYYQIFKNATNPDSGEIDWDEVDKLEGAFWASLTDPEIDELMANIRVIEGEYPEAIQKMVDAGRYAGSLELNIAGTVGTYYDLESHPALIEYVMRESGKDRTTVEGYLALPYLERVPAGKAEPGESIQEALVKAGREGGALYELKQQFVRQVDDEWIWAMMDSARSYRGHAKIEKGLYQAIREGQLVKPEIDYDSLYRDILRSI